MLQARGRIYYVDKNTFPDAEVLEKLMPLHPQQREMEQLAMQQQEDLGLDVARHTEEEHQKEEKQQEQQVQKHQHEQGEEQQQVKGS